MQNNQAKKINKIQINKIEMYLLKLKIKYYQLFYNILNLMLIL